MSRNRRRRASRIRQLGRLAWGLSLALLCSQAGSAQVVELNPVELSGVVRFGGFQISRLVVSTGSAVSETSPDNVETAPYSLIVQVPEGGSATYNVSIMGSVDTGTFQIGPRSVVVTDGEPATLDFIFDPPTVLEGTIELQGDGLLSGGVVNVRQTTTFSSNNFTLFVPFTPGGATSLGFRGPVVPGLQLRCTGAASFTSGPSVPLPPAPTVVIGEGGTARCDFVVMQPEVFALAGTIDFDGPVDIDRYRLALSGRSRASLLLEPPFDGPANRVSYRFDDLIPGTYSLAVSAETDEGPRVFGFPEPSNPIFSVGEGGDAIVDRSACQAFVEGEVEIGGTLTTAEVAGGVGLFGSSQQGSATFRAGATTSFDSETGRYELISTEGEWPLATVSIQASRDRFTAPGFVNSTIRLTDARGGPSLACLGRVERNFALQTGRVEIRFRVADGRRLSDPQLSGRGCELLDEENGEPVYGYDFEAVSENRTAALIVGRVAFEAPAGVCDDILAFAQVSGSNTTFGNLRDVEVVPGTEIVFEPMGPRVTIESPEPDANVDAGEIVVLGFATDDVAVASVSVNGTDAVLSATNNPSDPVEVAYQATIPVVSGENSITAVALDEDGLEASATISITNAATLPEPRPCDANGDDRVDRGDIAVIFGMRGSPASGLDDPLDVNEDGLITINDGRLCVLQCDNPSCQPAP